jgi:hypothetical protein
MAAAHPVAPAIEFKGLHFLSVHDVTADEPLSSVYALADPQRYVAAAAS